MHKSFAFAALVAIVGLPAELLAGTTAADGKSAHTANTATVNNNLHDTIQQSHVVKRWLEKRYYSGCCRCKDNTCDFECCFKK